MAEPASRIRPQEEVARRHAGARCLPFPRSRRPEGFWCGELTADTTLESDYILLQLWLHQPDEDGLESADPAAHRPGGAVDSGAPAARWRLQYLRRRPVGSQRHHQGVLRAEAGGHSAGERCHAVARAQRILALGGLQAANSYVKINLSLFGLYPRKHAPSVPPEIVMLPGQRALRNVLLDALHPGAALHRAGARLQPARAGGLHAGRTAAAAREPEAPQALRD